MLLIYISMIPLIGNVIVTTCSNCDVHNTVMLCSDFDEHDTIMICSDCEIHSTVTICVVIVKYIALL